MRPTRRRRATRACSWRCKPVGPASALAAPGTVPAAVADAATATASGSSSLGASALEVAKGELAKGVHEEGVNTGTDVDKYLAEAGVAPGNPWCASFVTWALAQSGHKMEGGGWAAVQTWVRAAEAGTNDLQIVSADQARPGDIVTYDWGGQEDFGADGHIGFLASNVEGGKFTALEGNNQDAVMSVPRQTTDANVKFLRIGGDAPPPAAAAPAAAVPAGGAAPYPAPAGGGAADVAAAATDAAAVSDQYPGDDAPKEQIAAWMAKQAEDRGLPPQLPVMASLVESGMKNLNFGDADSVGFYQMRVGIWNQGEYAGYPDKPELQVKWFLDQAEAVKAQRVAAGETDRRPQLLRRMDRRRRTPRRAVPRPLPGAARRGQLRCSGRPPRRRPSRPRRRRRSSTRPPRRRRPRRPATPPRRDAGTAVSSCPSRPRTPRRPSPTATPRSSS